MSNYAELYAEELRQNKQLTATIEDLAMTVAKRQVALVESDKQLQEARDEIRQKDDELQRLEEELQSSEHETEAAYATIEDLKNAAYALLVDDRADDCPTCLIGESDAWKGLARIVDRTPNLRTAVSDSHEPVLTYSRRTDPETGELLIDVIDDADANSQGLEPAVPCAECGYTQLACTCAVDEQKDNNND